LPQAQDEIRQLTRVFVEARYSQHEIASDQDRRARADWNKIKEALRTVKRQRDKKT
jgi:hypothetical protein